MTVDSIVRFLQELAAADIEIPRAMMPEGSAPRAFFALGTCDDADGDGIPDADESLVYGTDPASTDTDGNGMADGREIAIGTNPRPKDTDGDGLEDDWEVVNGLDPLSAVGDDGANGDPGGVGPCNNPVYLGSGTTNHVAVCGEDDTSRSRLARHRYVFAEGVIFDACFGPELGTKTNIEYLKSLIDSSTEAERLWSLFSPMGVPTLPSKMKFETRNYLFIGGN